MSKHPRHLAPRARLTPGTLIDGRYTIVDTLGAGGYATVYQARQYGTQREVALKILSARPDLPSRALHARFLREAQLAAQVRHPNAVTLYDFGWINHRPVPSGYLAMELLRGRDLARELTLMGSIPAERALELLLGCLDALSEAHAKQIVHGDLKPSNLFIHHREGAAQESLVLLDFGVARRASLASSPDAERSGTPQYMAPEYIHHGQASPAADVYQMGLILAEMLTGRAIVDHDSAARCIKVHTSGRLCVPHPLLDSPVGPILLTALAFDPASRYPDASALRDALKALDPSTLPGFVAERRPSCASLDRVSGSIRGTARPNTARTTSELEAPSTGPLGRTLWGERANRGSVRVARSGPGGAFEKDAPAAPEAWPDTATREADAEQTSDRVHGTLDRRQPHRASKTTPSTWLAAWGWALLTALVAAMVLAVLAFVIIL